MTLEYILKAALNSKRAPRCFSAHVVGEGYANVGKDPATRADYLKQLRRAVKNEIDNLGYATEYAERGYVNPKKGILFANWNVFPKDFDRLLERAGYAVEWSDEWTTCEECNSAFRTSANSYDWEPSGDGETCNDCKLDE